MDARLGTMLGNIEVLEPIAADALQVFGLRREELGGLTYTTLDEALAAEWLEVTEIDESGSVPEIKVTNKGDTMVLLIAGEHLIGAKQNRVLNASIMVDRRSETRIPVSCVESGRWGYRSRGFASGGSLSHSRLRRRMSRDAYDAYRCEGRPSSKQGEIWNEVNRKLRCMGSRSASSALGQVYEDYEKRLEEVVREVRVSEDCCGVVFAFSGRVAGVDLFDRPETLQKLLPKLVKAYAIDAIEESAEQADDQSQPAKPRSPLRMVARLLGKLTPTQGGAPRQGKLGREAVVSWLRDASTAKSESFDSPGLGQDVRVEGDDLVGASLVIEDQPVHTELFADDADHQDVEEPI